MPDMELESLRVRVTMDDKDYKRGEENILASLDRMIQRFQEFATQVAKAFETALTPMTALAQAMERLGGGSTAAVTAAAAPVQAMATAAQNATSQVTDLASKLAAIGSTDLRVQHVLDAIEKFGGGVNLAPLDQIRQHLESIGIAGHKAQDALINVARKAGLVTGSAIEGGPANPASASLLGAQLHAPEGALGFLSVKSLDASVAPIHAINTAAQQATASLSEMQKFIGRIVVQKPFITVRNLLSRMPKEMLDEFDQVLEEMESKGLLTMGKSGISATNKLREELASINLAAAGKPVTSPAAAPIPPAAAPIPPPVATTPTTNMTGSTTAAEAMGAAYVKAFEAASAATDAFITNLTRLGEVVVGIESQAATLASAYVGAFTEIKEASIILQSQISKSIPTAIPTTTPTAFSSEWVAAIGKVAAVKDSLIKNFMLLIEAVTLATRSAVGLSAAFIAAFEGIKKAGVGVTTIVQLISVTIDPASVSAFQTEYNHLIQQIKNIPEIVVSINIPALNAVYGEIDRTLSTVQTRIASFAAAVQPALTASFLPMSTALQKIGQFVNSVSRADLSKIDLAIEPVKRFTDAMAQMSQSLNTANLMEPLREVSLSLQRISMLMRAINKVDLTEFMGPGGGMITGFQARANLAVSSIEQMLTKLSGLSFAGAEKNIASLAKLGTAIGKIQNFVRFGSRFETKPFTDGILSLANDLEPALGLLSEALNKIDVNGITKQLSAMSRIPSFIRFVGKFDTKPFTNGLLTLANDLQAALDILSEAVSSSSIGNITKQLSTIGKISSFVRFMGKFDSKPFTDGVLLLANDLGASLDLLSESLSNVNVSGITKQLSAMSQIPSFVRFMGKFDPKPFASGILLLARDLGPALRVLSAVIGTMDIEKITRQLKAISRMKSFVGFAGKYDPKPFASGILLLARDLGPALRVLSAVIGTVDVEKINKQLLAISRIQSFVRLMGKIDPGPISAGIGGLALVLQSDLPMLVNALKVADFESVRRNLNAISRILSFFRTVPKLNLNALSDLGKSVKLFMAQLSSIPVSGNLTSVVDTLSKLGVVAGNSAKYLNAMAKSGGAVPPIMNNTNVAVKNLTPSVNRATGAVSRLNTGFGNMLRGATSAGMGINMLRMSLLGLSGFGIMAFAKLDDSVTRVLGHMREFPDSVTHALSKGVLQQGVQNLAATTPTSSTDLISGVDLLASRGMNAAMAIKAMAEAESFALASGMKMEEATHRLVDIQFKLGMASTDVEKHMKNMTRISDVLVGIAPQVGSSVKELSDAMGHRFLSAMVLSNMSLEEGIALLGVYSERGIRSSEASDFAARAVFELTRRNSANFLVWRRLGIETFDAVTGKMKPMREIIDQLSQSMGHLSPMQKVVQLQLMGLENRAAMAIVPLMGMSSRFREIEEATGAVSGTTAKFAAMLRLDLQSQLHILWNNVTQIAMAVGRLLAPVIGVLNYGIRTLTAAFRSLNPAMQNLIVGSTVFMLLLGPSVYLVRQLGFTLVGILLTPLRLLVSPLRLVWTGMMMLAGVFRFVGSGVAMVARGIYLLIAGTIGLTLSVIRFFATGVLLRAYNSVVLTLTTTWNRLVDAVKFLSNVGKFVLSSVWSGLKLLWTGITNLVSITWQFGRIAVNAFLDFLAAARLIGGFIISNLWTSIKSMAQLIWSSFSNIGSLITKVGKTLLDLFINLSAAVANFGMQLAAAVAGALVNIIPFLIGLALAALMVVPAILLISTAISTVVGLGATLAIGAYQLVHGIATGIVLLWEAVKSGFAALSVGMGSILASITEAWNNIKNGAKSAFDSFTNWASRVAGFFWNIGKNAQFIFSFVQDNWQVLINQMGEMIVFFIETTAHNFQVLFGGLVTAGKQAFTGLWNVITTYFGAAFEWVNDHWQDLCDDMSYIFKTFLTNLVDNISTLIIPIGDVIAAGLYNSSLGPMLKFFGIGSGGLNMNQAIAGVMDAFGKMKGPLDGFDSGKLKTPAFGGAGGLGGALSSVDFSGMIKTMFGDMGKTLTTMFGQFKNIIPGFDANSPLGKLLEGLDTTLPEKLGDQLAKMLRGGFDQFAGGDEGALFTGKQGPGFTAKEISLERYTIGGAANELLDYQQLRNLVMLNDNLKLLIGATIANKPPKPVNPGLK